jgi:hypothetical protein
VVLINCYSDCPEPETIAPCVCSQESKDIQCFGESVELLKLDNIENKTFNTLYIKETSISVIESFENINFDKVIVQNNSKLIRIHEYAFKKEPKLLLWISNNPKLESYLIFRFIRLLETTETIKLTDNQIDSIPPNLFNTKSQLKSLSVSRNNISWIEKNSFIELKKLVEFELDNNRINKIDDFGFNFTSDGNSDRKINISLNDNKLNDQSFKSEAFPDNKHITLDMNFQNNNFTKIKEQSFGSLVDNRKNHLSFANNHINCDCDILWILEKTNKTYVSGLDCNEQKKSLFDLTKSDFKCTTTPATKSTTTTTMITTNPNLTTTKNVSTAASTTPITITTTISTTIATTLSTTTPKTTSTKLKIK